MRLIDVDKVRIEITVPRGRKIVQGVIDKLNDKFNKLPIVDAIPVEWIKKQLKEEKYRTFLVDYIEWGDCLRWLIDTWEEENETD